MEPVSKQKDDDCSVLNGVQVIIDSIKQERDSEDLLWEICGKVLEIFHCDRAWLLFPCDPLSSSWEVPIERTVAEFPGANTRGLTIDMTPDVAAIFQVALDSGGPVVYGPGGLPLAENTRSFNVKSQLSMAIFPRIGKPWQFGIHQCSYERTWRETEVKLFQIIGIMIAEALGNILLVHDLQTANENLEQRVDERTAEVKAEKDFAERLIETAQAIVLVLDTAGRIVRFNPYMEAISHYLLNEVRGKDWFDTFVPAYDRERIRKIFHRAVNDVASEGVINSIVTKDGQEKIIEWYSKTLKDQAQEVIGVLAIGHDVTQRLAIEEKIRTSLEEKELLLQEIHHRVKNNMQVISSLIGIQRSQMQDAIDPAILGAFVETENRIKSMALVHEGLYRSSNFAHVAFTDYIQQLAADLFHAYLESPDSVAFEAQLENIDININQAIPCGLIVHELLSNALKYAFPRGRKGKIVIKLRAIGDKIYQLSVCDDGIGLPQRFSIADAKTTGMLIVTALVRQLGADMTVAQDDGTCFEIRFTGS